MILFLAGTSDARELALEINEQDSNLSNSRDRISSEEV